MKKRLFSFGKSFLQHELVSNSFFLFVGSTFANFLAFLFNLFLARVFTSADYGIFASLTSLVTLWAIPSQFLTTVITKFATGYLSKNEIPKAAKLYKNSFSLLTFTGFLIVVFFILCQKYLAGFLHVQNVFFILLSGITAGSIYIGVVNTSYLQSLLKFRYMALGLILSNFAKLLTGIVLILIGFKVVGGLYAVLISYITLIVFYFIPLRHIAFTKTKSISISISEIIRFALPTILTVFALSSFTTTDIILVKHFFSPQQAGLYAGVSLIGRVIFYFTSPVP
ncbi:MAG: oligosaccharide flippase family protein, partial [Candidatus Levyibacteriota bacterium]